MASFLYNTILTFIFFNMIFYSSIIYTFNKTFLEIHATRVVNEGRCTVPVVTIRSIGTLSYHNRLRRELSLFIKYPDIGHSLV